MSARGLTAMSLAFLGLLLAGLLTGPAFAVSDDLRDALAGPDVVIVGETHDNRAHHDQQAEIAGVLQPSALVFEMITPERAVAARGTDRRDLAAMKSALDWEGAGWPDFAFYHPIIAAAPGAQVYGAWVPRRAAREAMGAGIAESFGRRAGRFGLTAPLAEEEQAAREAHQSAAHCDALPDEMLPVMVELQRLRDAVLARETLRALDETGGPVLVITGNGHARADRGMPVPLALARSGLSVLTIGQGEGGAPPPGRFEIVLDAPEVARDDPCAGLLE